MAFRNNLSPDKRRAAREQSEAAALAELEREAHIQREKSLRLRKARLARDQNKK